jgi:protease-4
VDRIAYPDQVEDRLDELFGGEVRLVQVEDLPQPHSAWEEPKQIAVIYVEGAITSGESRGGGPLGLGANSAGAKTVVRQLHRARKDPQVRAVVLRVDSPGGSSFASDEIWRAVEQVKQENKPVIVSMGGVAASGGYYVAAGADAIWAQPNTITGSIGVFSGKFATEELLDQVGIHTTTLERGRNADIFDANRWDDVERQRMQTLVDDIYEQFKEKVAQGRDMTPEQVEEVARGRVWSGSDALENGLVDELGGLREAIEDAKRRANIPAKREVALVHYAGSGSLIESLSPTLMRTAFGPLPRWLGKAATPKIDVRLPELPQRYGTLYLLATQNEDVWLMLPHAMEVGPR